MWTALLSSLLRRGLEVTCGLLTLLQNNMRSFVSWTWNSSIHLSGGLCGAVLAFGVKRSWLYFPFISQALSLLPFAFGWKFRRAAYSRLLAKIGDDAVLHFGVLIEDERSSIGNDVWVSAGCYLDYVEIGDRVLVGPQAVLLAGGHAHRSDTLSVPIKHQGNHPKKPLRIENGAWVGARAVVLAHVGHDSIIGAGAVVTRPVPPYAIVAGNPARIIRMRGVNAPELRLGTR